MEILIVVGIPEKEASYKRQLAEQRGAGPSVCNRAIMFSQHASKAENGQLYVTIQQCNHTV